MAITPVVTTRSHRAFPGPCAAPQSARADTDRLPLLIGMNEQGIVHLYLPDAIESGERDEWVAAVRRGHNSIVGGGTR